MARIANSSLSGLNGHMGDMVFYQINGVTYARRKPSKRSNTQKKRMRKSPINERSQGKFSMVHTHLKGLKFAIRFGFQEQVKGARHAYHACGSHTRLNCFRENGADYHIDPALFKISTGTLMGAEEAKAVRTEEGILFTWKDNSGTSSAQAWDEAFLVIHNPTQKAAVWKELGSFRNKKEYLLKHTFGTSGGDWHAYLAFSQENRRTKKRKLSDSVYLGVI
ncbi:DUF6266 family protein [uncultured Algoriphagus sp.]|uniref:DUF6266 family protein n=1 Tax=uncultured Algoriphagus sp. TaxID=417365 RepID=UPI0030EEA0FF